MARYVDGFLLAVPKKKLDAYRRMARKAGKIWREHGALDYRECVGEDLRVRGMRSFRSTAGARRNEVVIFAWIAFRSRKHRDRVNRKVMEDPRMAKIVESQEMPFDVRRMSYGGFEVLVGA